MYKPDATQCHIKTETNIVARQKENSWNNHIKHLSKRYQIPRAFISYLQKEFGQKKEWKRTLVKPPFQLLSIHTYHDVPLPIERHTSYFVSRLTNDLWLTCPYSCWWNPKHKHWILLLFFLLQGKSICEPMIIILINNILLWVNDNKYIL